MCDVTYDIMQQNMLFHSTVGSMELEVLANNAKVVQTQM
jgi:hypothetical protein